MENRLVSIIMPVYNTQDYLDRAIKSVLDQDYTDFEFIIVDDGSTDHSFEMCKSYASMDDRIVLLHQENMGQSVARNAALDIAKGDFIFFPDSDDYMEPNMIRVLMQAQSKTDADIVMCNVSEEIKAENAEPGILLNNILMDNIGGQLWKFLFKRYIWDDIRMPEGRIAQDAAVIHKCVRKAAMVEIVPLPLYHYNVENPVSTSLNPKNSVKGAVDRAIMFIDRYNWMKENHVGDQKTYDVVLRKATAFSIGSVGLLSGGGGQI